MRFSYYSSYAWSPLLILSSRQQLLRSLPSLSGGCSYRSLVSPMCAAQIQVWTAEGYEHQQQWPLRATGICGISSGAGVLDASVERKGGRATVAELVGDAGTATQLTADDGCGRRTPRTGDVVAGGSSPTGLKEIGNFGREGKQMYFLGSWTAGKFSQWRQYFSLPTRNIS